jgi:hypothetical protein
VLAVKTGHGDFALDNLSDEIRPWTATGYQFYKRQAEDDPNVWLSLGGATGAAPGTAASNLGPTGTGAAQPAKPGRLAGLRLLRERPVPRASYRSGPRSPSGWRPDALVAHKIPLPN